MTTNMPELLDPAIKDRLYPIRFLPTLDTLKIYIKERTQELHITEFTEEIMSKIEKEYNAIKDYIEQIRKDPNKLLTDEDGKINRFLREKMPSIRRIEKMIQEYFIRKITSKKI